MGELAIIPLIQFQPAASAAGWIDIVKEAADPALYPSAFRIGLTTTKSSNNLSVLRTREARRSAMIGMFFTAHGFV